MLYIIREKTPKSSEMINKKGRYVLEVKTEGIPGIITQIYSGVQKVERSGSIK